MVDYEVGGTWYKLNDWLGIEWNRWRVEDKKILRECKQLIVYLLKYLWNKELCTDQLPSVHSAFYPMTYIEGRSYILMSVYFCFIKICER